MSIAAEILQPLRPLAKMADVVRIEHVWDDPDGMVEAVKRRTPFNLIYGASAYENLGGADPWFRDYWVGEKRAPVAELDHSDDLTMDLIWDVLGDDLKIRGVSSGLPADPMHDRDFRTLLLKEYPNPGQRYFAGAKWR